MKKQNSILKNQNGFLTIDFIFSMVIAVCMSMMLFALCFTLSTVEIAQYVAYSVARSYHTGQIDSDAQEQAGRAKLQKILSSTTFGQLFNKQYGWFELSNLEIKKGLTTSDQFAEYSPEKSNNRLPQTGVRLTLTAKILNFKVGPLGSSSSENDGLFTTRVTGLLFREPTVKECQAQMAYGSRYQAILDLDDRYQRLMDQQTSKPTPTDYLPLEDNGC